MAHTSQHSSLPSSSPLSSCSSRSLDVLDERLIRLLTLQLTALLQAMEIALCASEAAWPSALPMCREDEAEELLVHEQKQIASFTLTGWLADALAVQIENCLDALTSFSVEHVSLLRYFPAFSEILKILSLFPSSLFHSQLYQPVARLLIACFESGEAKDITPALHCAHSLLSLPSLPTSVESLYCTALHQHNLQQLNSHTQPFNDFFLSLSFTRPLILSSLNGPTVQFLLRSSPATFGESALCTLFAYWVESEFVTEEEIHKQLNKYFPVKDVSSRAEHSAVLLHRLSLFKQQFLRLFVDANSFTALRVANWLHSTHMNLCRTLALPPPSLFILSLATPSSSSFAELETLLSSEPSSAALRTLLSHLQPFISLFSTEPPTAAHIADAHRVWLLLCLHLRWVYFACAELVYLASSPDSLNVTDTHRSSLFMFVSFVYSPFVSSSSASLLSPSLCGWLQSLHGILLKSIAEPSQRAQLSALFDRQRTFFSFPLSSDPSLSLPSSPLSYICTHFLFLFVPLWRDDTGMESFLKTFASFQVDRLLHSCAGELVLAYEESLMCHAAAVLEEALIVYGPFHHTPSLFAMPAEFVSHALHCYSESLKYQYRGMKDRKSISAENKRNHFAALLTESKSIRKNLQHVQLSVQS